MRSNSFHAFSFSFAHYNDKKISLADISSVSSFGDLLRENLARMNGDFILAIKYLYVIVQRFERHHNKKENIIFKEAGGKHFVF